MGREQQFKGTHIILVEYPNMNVDIRNHVPLVDFNAFISAVGGGLGLFLGFSIIETLLYIYKLIFTMLSKKTLWWKQQ